MGIPLRSCVLMVASLSLGAGTINLNPGFEAPVITTAPPTPLQTFDPLIKAYLQADVPGWTTTDSNGAIEIWRTGAQGFSAYQGQQWAEINAYSAGTLTAFVTPPAGSKIGVEVAHRGRGSSTVADVMRVVVTDLGLLPSSGDDLVLYTSTFSATNVAWIFHTVNFGLATGHMLRLDLTAVSTASGSQSVGNFVDAVAFGETDFANIPEPSSWALVLAGFIAMARHRGFRRGR